MSTVLEYSGRAEKTVNRLYIYIYREMSVWIISHIYISTCGKTDPMVSLKKCCTKVVNESYIF